MSMVISDEQGGQIVRLFLPFEYNGAKVESIRIAAVEWGQTLDWKQGKYPGGMLSLLVEMTGGDEAIIRKLRYPDVDRVLTAFLQLLPAEIRNDLEMGQLPLPPDLEPVKVEEPPPAEPELPLFTTPPTESEELPEQLRGPVAGGPGPEFDYTKLPHIPKGPMPGEPLPEDFRPLSSIPQPAVGTGASGFDLEDR